MPRRVAAGFSCVVPGRQIIINEEPAAPVKVVTMYISQYMTADPITISDATLLPEARQILNEYQIRHLPVIDGGRRLIGIISDRDLRSAYPSSVTTQSNAMLVFEQVEKTSVGDIMTTSCSTLSPDDSIDDGLILFDRDKVGGIPVVSEENVVLGIFSLLDLTAAYRQLFGVVEEGSILIGIEDDGRENLLSDMVTLLETNNIPLTRLIRLGEKKHGAMIYIRVNSLRPTDVYKLLKTKGFKILQA